MIDSCIEVSHIPLFTDACRSPAPFSTPSSWWSCFLALKDALMLNPRFVTRFNSVSVKWRKVRVHKREIKSNLSVDFTSLKLQNIGNSTSWQVNISLKDLISFSTSLQKLHNIHTCFPEDKITSIYIVRKSFHPPLINHVAFLSPSVWKENSEK